MTIVFTSRDQFDWEGFVYRNNIEVYENTEATSPSILRLLDKLKITKSEYD